MSKANQAFNNNDEAVSPVIGVILMVAITVVLAAVVFVLVSNLGDTSEDAPDLSFSKDSSEGSLTVISAQDSQWNDFTVSGCDVLDIGATTEDISDGSISETTDVGAGDKLEGCSGAVTITHLATNTLVYSTSFA